jgi:hypothetical protein
VSGQPAKLFTEQASAQEQGHKEQGRKSWGVEGRSSAAASEAASRGSFGERRETPSGERDTPAHPELSARPRIPLRHLRSTCAGQRELSRKQGPEPPLPLSLVTSPGECSEGKYLCRKKLATAPRPLSRSYVHQSELVSQAGRQTAVLKLQLIEEERGRNFTTLPETSRRAARKTAGRSHGKGIWHVLLLRSGARW